MGLDLSGVCGEIHSPMGQQEGPIVTAQTWTGAEVVEVDPRDLVLDGNPRTVDDIATARPHLVPSVEQHGVLLPVVARRGADGALHVEDGFCRTLAAIRHIDRCPTIPVLVTDSDDESASRLLIHQWILNEHRSGFDTLDKARLLEQLSLFGISADEIAAELTTHPDEVAAGLRVARSAAATQVVVEHPQLDLLQADAIAEFDGDGDALERLQRTLEAEPGRFDHQVARLRQDRQDRQLIETETAKLIDGGTTVVEEGAAEFFELRTLKGADDEPLTPENHADCPGHAATVCITHSGEVRTSYGCINPGQHGHRDRYAPGSGRTHAMTEADKVKARRVRENNKAWRAALTVRRRFLADLVQGKAAPKRLLQHTLTAFLLSSAHLQAGIGPKSTLACKLLGLKAPSPGRRNPILGKVARANADQLQKLILAVVLGSFEQRYDLDHTVNTWRTPYGDDELYFRILRDLGYKPSTVEELVLDPTADADQWPQLAEPDTAAERAVA